MLDHWLILSGIQYQVSSIIYHPAKKSCIFFNKTPDLRKIVALI